MHATIPEVSMGRSREIESCYAPYPFLNVQLKKNRMKSQDDGSLGRKSRREVIVNKRKKGQ